MTDRGPAGRFLFDPIAEPDLYEDILAKRIVAFFIDAVVVAVLMLPAAVLVLILGILTLGLGFVLFPPLFFLVALGYVAVTLGSPRSATLGMRITGVEFRTWNGQRMFRLLAVMHLLGFWLSLAFAPVLLVGLFTYRKQLLHDLLLGVVALNSDALRRRDRPIVE